MADDQAMELESEAGGTVNTGNVKKNIPIKLKTQPKPTRGRPRKASKIKKEASPPDIPETDENSSVADSEFIDAPIFKQPGEPLHQSQALRWNHKVNLIGEKVVDPLIHCCDKCKLPILIYGRMIPCKHVFCFDCARKTDKVCPRCEENVQRIEQSALGTVFVCSYGGPKHGDGGCRRTYLSHRDLQAHIYHRHMRTDSAKSSSSTSQAAGAGKPVVEQYTTSKVSSKSQHSTPIIEQYTTAAGRHASGESHLNLPHSRPSDAMYQQSILGQIPPQAQALPTQAMLQGPPPRLPLSQGQPPAQAIIPGQQADSYQLASMSALAPGRKTNLITVPLQDDSDYRRRDLAAGYGSLPPSTFSTSLPPPGGIAQAFPSMHQGPQATSIAGFPPSGPPPFTSPPLRTQLPVSSGVSVPISHPPPISVPTPNLATPPPPLLSGPRMPIQGGQPPRFGSPQGHFNDSYSQSAPGGQNTRGPWTGPPPQRSSGGQSQRSQSEGYQYYQ